MLWWGAIVPGTNMAASTLPSPILTQYDILEWNSATHWPTLDKKIPPRQKRRQIKFCLKWWKYHIRPETTIHSIIVSDMTSDHTLNVSLQTHSEWKREFGYLKIQGRNINILYWVWIRVHLWGLYLEYRHPTYKYDKEKQFPLYQNYSPTYRFHVDIYPIWCFLESFYPQLHLKILLVLLWLMIYCWQ